MYFWYFLSYLGCVGRMVSGFCTILLAGSCATIQQLLLMCKNKNFASCPGGNDLSTSSFGDIAIVYTLHLRHFCWCFCCRPLIDRHRVVALYSFDQKLVWVRSIVLLFLSSRRPFVFIVKTSIPSSIAVLFL